MLELYTHPMSPCAQKVRIVLAEKGLDWTKHHIELSQKENLTEEYLKLNPLGVVPTLVHDGRPVIESNVICEYLEDIYPTPSLRPSSHYEVANMRLWMKHVDTKLHPSCGALQWPLVMRPALMEKSEDERQALLERIPEKPRRERQKRLVAHGLDAPDVIDAVHVYRKTILQFGWTEMYDDCPRVGDWFERCRSRNSYETSVACDFPPEIMADLRAKGEQALQKIRQHLNALK